MAKTDGFYDSARVPEGPGRPDACLNA